MVSQQDEYLKYILLFLLPEHHLKLILPKYMPKPKLTINEKEDDEVVHGATGESLVLEKGLKKKNQNKGTRFRGRSRTEES